MCWLCWLVLFFKQKTAYEMRISDWSSDVCSSDLAERVDGACTIFGFILVFIYKCAFLDRIAVGQLVGYQQWACRQDHVVAVFAAYAQYVVVGRTVRLVHDALIATARSEEHTSELQSLMRLSYAVFCLKKKKTSS